MTPFVGYSQVKVGTIPQAKLKKALEGKAVRLTNAELSGNRVMLVHPANAKAIKKSQKEGRGMIANFSPGEMRADLKYHDSLGGSLTGGSAWDWIKNAAGTAAKWLKDTGIASTLADVAQGAATPFIGDTLAKGARGALREVTGVGVKGSPEAKAKMAAMRAKRKTGGSFRIN